jgi:nitrate reductase gamma subunit
MDEWNTLAFLVLPYLSLAVFAVGHLYRYFTDPLGWNSRSSELLEKNSLKYSSYLFHGGILLTLVGHAGGLLIPQAIYDKVGISGETHTRMAIWVGAVIGLGAFGGLMGLTGRRIFKERVRGVTAASDWAALLLLPAVVGAGLYNVFFGGYYVLDTIAPWVRSIVILAPEPGLMSDVPASYQIHILGAFILFAFSPFTRLVHIWSVPFTYLFRRFLVFRAPAGREETNAVQK